MTLADPPLGRLRLMAELLQMSEPTSAVGAELGALADELAAEPAPEPAPTGRLCQRPSGKERCDRPTGHAGDCSWEATRIRRRYREAEERAARVGPLERQVRDLRAIAARQERKLKAEQLKAEAMRSRGVRAAIGKGTRRRRRVDRG